LGRGEYYLLLAAFWLYSLVWLGAGVWLVVQWERIGWPGRVLFSGGLLIMSPTLEDLCRSYEKYRKLHEQGVFGTRGKTSDDRPNSPGSGEQGGI
jgi:hypothetical protein